MKILKSILPYIIIILTVILIRTFVLTPVIVSGSSMADTLKDGEILILKKYDKTYERFDIVVFDLGDSKLVKRVVGLPGETLEIKEGHVYINGEINESVDEHIKETYIGDYGPYTIPENCYFMMGDNRNNSLDSRFWENKFVEEDDILGKVIFKYFPGIEFLE